MSDWRPKRRAVCGGVVIWSTVVDAHVHRDRADWQDDPHIIVVEVEIDEP